jgi:hypothetical protein
MGLPLFADKCSLASRRSFGEGRRPVNAKRFAVVAPFARIREAVS